MSSEKRKEFLESIRQNNSNETQDANSFLNAKLQPTEEEEEKHIFIEVPKNVENIDYGNVFLNAKVQTEEYIRRKSKKEER